MIHTYHTDNGPKCPHHGPPTCRITSRCDSTIYTYTANDDHREVDSYCHGCNITVRPAFRLNLRAEIPTNARDYSRIHRDAANGIEDNGRRTVGQLTPITNDVA